VTKLKKMVKPERRKIAAGFPKIAEEFGFVRVEGAIFNEWWRENTRGGSLRITLFDGEDDGRPWLACQFLRPNPRPDLAWDAPENERIFNDLADSFGANPFSGKANLHFFGVDSGTIALDHVRWHLIMLIGEES
jgi:hypothetical protein